MKTIRNASVAIDARYINRPGMGIHTYLIALIELLRKRGYKLTFLTDKETDFKLQSGEQIVVLTASNRFWWEQVTLSKFLRCNSFELYIAPSNFGIPLFGNRRTKSVLVVHDYIPLRFPRTYLLKRPFYAMQFLVSIPLSLYRSDVILTNSEFTANETRKLFKKNAVNAYIPVKYEKYKVDPINAKKYGKYLLYNGGPDARKNVGTLLKGFRQFSTRHPGYRLIVIGNGYNKYTAQCKAINANNIAFLGYVSEEDKQELICGSQAVVSASKMEGYGLPVVEAYRGSVPVVAPHNSAISELAGNAAIYMKGTRVADVVDALEELASLTPDQRDSLISEGQRRLNELNDFESDKVIISQLESLLL
jgi:glycosyltransferase involved in cell wall biosynthesis